MKKILFALGAVIISVFAAVQYFSSTSPSDPEFLARMDGPGSVAKRLGRPVKWREIGFADGFFSDFDQLNVSGELDQPGQEEFLSDNDTVAVALHNWEAIDALQGADHLPIPRDTIRQLDRDEFYFLTRFIHINPDGSFAKYYNILFFNMRMLVLLDEECQPIFVYEAVRLIALPQDKEKMAGKIRVKDCMEK